MRMNFNINDRTRTDLSLLASLEQRSMTEIITGLIDTYIQEHSQQLNILKSAMTEARNISNNDG